MDTVSDILTSRDIAIIFWAMVFIVFSLVKTNALRLAGDVIKQLLNYKIFMPLAISIAPLALVIHVLSFLGLWDLSMLKETVIWASAGMAMFLGSSKIRDGKELIKKITKDAFKLAIVLEFVINFYVFPLWIELLLVPFATLVVIMSTYANIWQDVKYALIKKVFNWLTAIIGFTLIYFAFVSFLNNPNSLLTAQNLKLLLLPIALTLAYIPSVYLLALFSSYELLFSRIDHFLGEKKGKYKVKLACLKLCSLSVKRVSLMSPLLSRELTITTQIAKAVEIVETSNFQELAAKSFPAPSL